MVLHEACVGCVSLGCWFSYDYFLYWNASLSDLLYWSSFKISTWFYKQWFVTVIAVVALVIELDIVEIDEMSDLFVDSYICSIFISFRTKIRCLRSVAYDVRRENLSELDCKSYEPLFSCSSLHSGVVFPININPI